MEGSLDVWFIHIEEKACVTSAVGMPNAMLSSTWSM